MVPHDITFHKHLIVQYFFLSADVSRIVFLLEIAKPVGASAMTSNSRRHANIGTLMSSIIGRDSSEGGRLVC